MGRTWTPHEDRHLIDLVTPERTLTAIAREHTRTCQPRSAFAVRARLRKLGCPYHALVRENIWRVFSWQRTAAIFGVSRARVARWIRDDLLVAKQHKRSKLCTTRRRQFAIHEEAIYDFMRIERAWPEWNTANITDADIRDVAEELRTDQTFWLTYQEFADQLGYTIHTVHCWVAKGLLTTERIGKCSFIHCDVAAAFVPPLNRKAADVQRGHWLVTSSPHVHRRVAHFLHNGITACSRYRAEHVRTWQHASETMPRCKSCETVKDRWR